MAKKKKKKKEKSKDESCSIGRNKKAFFEYEIIERLECGIVLTGTEVKSLRGKNVSFSDCYVMVSDGQLSLIGLNIAEYSMGNIHNHEPTRTRRLLAHKKQIAKLEMASNAQGMTLVPLNLHWSRGKAKVEVGLARGKATYDKRGTIQKRELDRQKQRTMRNYGR